MRYIRRYYARTTCKKGFTIFIPNILDFIKLIKSMRTSDQALSGLALPCYIWSGKQIGTNADARFAYNSAKIGEWTKGGEMRLFDQIDRVGQDPASQSESAFHYLNRTAKPLFAFGREFLEDWFSRYPEAHKEELRVRFRSSGDAEHYAAFFELLLYQLFRRLGADIEIHPAMPNTASRPDFLIRSTKSSPFILEATVVTFQSKADVGAEARLNHIYDILNKKVDSPNCFISVEVNSSPLTQPPANQIVQFITDKLKDLDIDALSDLYQKGGYQEVPAWQFDHEEWSILFRPVPKSPEARGRSGLRPLGPYFSGWKLIDHTPALRDAVSTKAHKYGEIPYPFVVAIDALEPLDYGDVEAAFLKREYDGVWTSRKESSRRRVSAVLLASNLLPWSLGETKCGVFYNPWATSSMDFAFSKISQYILHDDGLMVTEGQPLPELLGVAWPP